LSGRPMRRRNDCESGEYSPSVSERGFSFGVPREDGGTVSSLGRTFQGRCNVSMRHPMVQWICVGSDADAARTERQPYPRNPQITTRRSAPEQEHKNPPRTLHRNRNTTRTILPSFHGRLSIFAARWAVRPGQALWGLSNVECRECRPNCIILNTGGPKRASRWIASPQPLERVGVPRVFR